MGQHLSKVPSGFQHGVKHESLRNVSGITSRAFDSQADKYAKYILMHFACTGIFFGFLLLLSWYYGRSHFERWDPVKAANEERDAAIEQRDAAIEQCDDAQRTWQKAETKYEKALATNLSLRSRLEKDSKLEHRLSELVEETNIQHNAIERLEAIKQEYDKLVQQVNDYGLSAKRPESYQKRSTSLQRQLEISKNSLQNSQSYAKGLEEKLRTQLEKPSKEITWLRTRLRKNARSTAYWARYRQHADNPDFKPAWGVRCACTEPDIGYSLKDQGPRIIELEDTVTRVLNTPNVAEAGVRAKAEEGLTAKDRVIRQLREDVTARNQTIKEYRDEKVTAGDDLAASRQKFNELLGEKEAVDRNATTSISDLNHTLSESHKDLANARQELGQQKAKVEELQNDIEVKNVDLNDLRRENTEFKEQSETQTAKIGEWEAAGREFDARIEAKDNRIAEEQVNNAPNRDFAESQIRSYNEAIYKKDRDYKELYDHYYIVLGEKKALEDKYNGDVQTFNTMQQGYADKWEELQRRWTEHCSSHVNCGGQIANLTNQVRHGANAHADLQKALTGLQNTHTDLQAKHNAQAEELDVANQNVQALRGQLAQLSTTLGQMSSSSEIDFEKYRIEGENRARPIWQANVAQEASAQRLRLEESEGKIFKLENQLQQAKKQTNPLQEMQLKEREVAVKAKEDALKKNTDRMDHDQKGSTSGGSEIEDLERRLAAANQESVNAKNRNRVVSGQLNTEKRERSEDKARHAKLLKEEQENSKTKCNVLRISLEKENPLKRVVSRLQDEVTRLQGEVEKRT